MNNPSKWALGLGAPWQSWYPCNTWYIHIDMSASLYRYMYSSTSIINSRNSKLVSSTSVYLKLDEQQILFILSVIFKITQYTSSFQLVTKTFEKIDTRQLPKPCLPVSPEAPACRTHQSISTNRTLPLFTKNLIPREKTHVSCRRNATLLMCKIHSQHCFRD